MKTFEDFREHHQKDAHGRVVEHGDGTPSSVEEAVGAVAGGAAKVALGGAALAGKAAVKGAKFAGKAAAYLGKKAGNRIGKELVKATSDVDNNADKEFDKVKVKRYKETPVKEDYYSGTGEKVQARTKKWMDKKGQKGAPGLDAMKARTAEHKAKRGVKEEVDAYKYVVSKLKKKYGSGVLTKGDKIKPQSAADKAKARAHQAKVDAENAAERAKDPSQGRYPKG